MEWYEPASGKNLHPRYRAAFGWGPAQMNAQKEGVGLRKSRRGGPPELRAVGWGDAEMEIQTSGVHVVGCCNRCEWLRGWFEFFGPLNSSVTMSNGQREFSCVTVVSVRTD
jgi:hypothetical protein